MSLLANLTTDASIEDEKDSVGGGYAPWDSGIYATKVALAYLSKSKGGALALNLTLTDASGRELRQQLWMTSGTEKGCKNYYEKDGEKRYLPGFLHANALCLLTIGKEISQADTDTKVINVYSPEAKAEVPTQVEMVTDLLGQEVLVGVIKQMVDKNVKDAAGNYVASGETREENEIDKFFRARDKKTTAEIRAQAEATFHDTWEKKWAGQVKDRSSKTAGKGTAGAPGAPSAPNGKPATSLFNN